MSSPGIVVPVQALSESHVQETVMQCGDLTTCTLCSRSDDSLQGPIRCCSDIRVAGVDPGEELNLRNDDTLTDEISPNMEMKCSSACSYSVADVNSCHRAEGDRHYGGGAVGGAIHRLDKPTSQVDINPVTLTSCSDSDTEEGDMTREPPPPPPGELNLPTAAALPRNTFECSYQHSTPGQLAPEDGGSESELQSKRPEIMEYFSSRKQRTVSHSVAGWKLFGKVPPKQSPSKQARTIQQEYEARQAAARNSPTHHAAGQQSRRNVEFEPLSTTALILQDRPPNLPAKSAEEMQRHREQYEQMVAGAKRRELKEAQKRQQQVKDRIRQEEVISNATLVWNQHILPHWDTMRTSRRARDLWWGGLPPSIRGRVWSLSIGNELNITAELYEIFLSRAEEKWRNLSETETDNGESLTDKESSLELITQDISRTFHSLCVFQKGGPYHDLLQNILGAYTCYRPDVGYVQGMSSTAAMLILNMDEVEAFISFSNLINRPYAQVFQGLRGLFQGDSSSSLPSLPVFRSDS
uniref:TBC1 domain family member 12-like isoform X2 n=1 Tax=Scatophagus argus TaxID=75038 RepID=UPI001ED82D41|nr:TBC1 domain family member 12-like isoform X2 [Scatophagus argus]